MPDLDDGDGMEAIIHFKEDSEVPLPYPKPILARELLTSPWLGLHREVLDPADYAATVLPLQGFQLLDGGWLDAELIVVHGASYL